MANAAKLLRDGSARRATRVSGGGETEIHWSLARALLCLGRTKATGLFRVFREGVSTVGIRNGELVFVALDPAHRGQLPKLGKLLGVRALPPTLGLVGEALLARGDCDGTELEAALHEQQNVALAALMRLGGRARFSLTASGDIPGSSRPLLPSLLRALRSSLSPETHIEPNIGRMQLRPWAEPLLPREDADVISLRAVLDAHETIPPELHKEFLLWRRIGLLEARSESSHSHSLLLRKRNALRSSDRDLLDLDAKASWRARKAAIKELVAALHPDRFDDALRETSEDVIQAALAQK